MSRLTDEESQFIKDTALWLKTHLATPTQAEAACEIELRFGSFADSHASSSSASAPASRYAFVSGLNINAWQRVRTLLCSTDPDAHANAPKSVLEIVTAYGDGNRQIEHADGSVTRQYKALLGRRDWVLREPQTRQLVACRLSHSVERQASASASAVGHGKSKVGTTTRIRARTSFWHRVWRIDLTIVQQGLDREAASRAPALYEIEIELEPQRIDWSKQDYHYLAHSLLLKVQEIAAAIHGASLPESTDRLPARVQQSDFNAQFPIDAPKRE
jgi:hypothetical protein